MFCSAIPSSSSDSLRLCAEKCSLRATSAVDSSASTSTTRPGFGRVSPNHGRPVATEIASHTSALDFPIPPGAASRPTFPVGSTPPAERSPGSRISQSGGGGGGGTPRTHGSTAAVGVAISRASSATRARISSGSPRTTSNCCAAIRTRRW